MTINKQKKILKLQEKKKMWLYNHDAIQKTKM